MWGAHGPGLQVRKGFEGAMLEGHVYITLVRGAGEGYCILEFSRPVQRSGGRDSPVQEPNSRNTSARKETWPLGPGETRGMNGRGHSAILRDTRGRGATCSFTTLVLWPDGAHVVNLHLLPLRVMS